MKQRERSADLRQAVEDAGRLLKIPQADRDEIKSTFQTVLKPHDGRVPALEYAAILAPLARNRNAWDYVREIRGPRLRAYLGRLANERFLHDGPTQDEKEQWCHLVEHSARRGHRESRILVVGKRLPQIGLLRKPFFAAFRIYQILRCIPILASNPKDDRLPRKLRNADSPSSESN